ncbi:uncharacterized protein [Apostichopus japonicus]|uniref:uncharacterized protein isoform X3 n=1 Tax=Stichopus japonicus TaxID=307972 RepID=UPI003AB73E33
MEDDSSSSANEIMTRVDSKSNVQRQQLFDTGSDEKAAITLVQNKSEVVEPIVDSHAGPGISHPLAVEKCQDVVQKRTIRQRKARQRKTAESRSVPWTVTELLKPRSGFTIARKELLSVMREVSGKHNVISIKSKSCQLAVTEVMNRFESLKPLVNESPTRACIAQTMMSNIWTRKYQRLQKRGKSAKIVHSGNNPSWKKKVVDKDVVCRGEANEDKDEKTTSLEQNSEFDKELSLEAKKLLNGHRPIHEWQRLKKMMRLSSDALGLVGLQQERSLETIKQILADFPQLQPYVDNVVIQRKLQKHMLGNLKARINCDQKRLAEFYLKNDTRKKHLKQTSLMSRVRKLTDISALKNSNNNKLPPVPEIAPPKKTESDEEGGLEQLQNVWKKHELLSRDLNCPARLSLVKTMVEVSYNLNVVSHRSENYHVAITQVMNYFAALKPLVNVERYRGLIGKRLLRSSKASRASRARSKRLKYGKTKQVGVKKTAEEKETDKDVKDGASNKMKCDVEKRCLPKVSDKEGDLENKPVPVTRKRKGAETPAIKGLKVKLKLKVPARKLETMVEKPEPPTDNAALNNENTCGDSSGTPEIRKPQSCKGVSKVLGERDVEGDNGKEERQHRGVTGKESEEVEDAVRVGRDVRQGKRVGNVKLNMKRLDEYLIVRKKRDVEVAGRRREKGDEGRDRNKRMEYVKKGEGQQREETQGIEEVLEEKDSNVGQSNITRSRQQKLRRRKRRKRPSENKVVDLTGENDDIGEDRKEGEARKESEERKEAEEKQEGEASKEGENIDSDEEFKKQAKKRPVDPCREDGVRKLQKNKLKRKKTLTVKVNALCMAKRNAVMNGGPKKRGESQVCLKDKTDEEEDEEEEEGKDGQSVADQCNEDGKEDGTVEGQINDVENCEKEGLGKQEGWGTQEGRGTEQGGEASSGDEGQDRKNEQTVRDEKRIEKSIQEKIINVKTVKKVEKNKITIEKENEMESKSVGGAEREENVEQLVEYSTIRDLPKGEGEARNLIIPRTGKVAREHVGKSQEDDSDLKVSEVGEERVKAGDDDNKESQEETREDLKEEAKESRICGVTKRKGFATKMAKGQRDPKKEPEIFEVDTILKHAQDCEGGDWYYVKWLGYSSDQNTWEPSEHLSGCSNLLKKFHRQLKRAQQTHLSRKRKLSDDGLVLGPKKPKLQKQPMSPVSTEALQAMVREELKNWTISLNCICTDTAPIVVENDVDFEGPPTDFTYINDYISGRGVTIPNDPLVGCECTKCSEDEPECCPQNSGVKFAYNRLKHIRVKPGTPIYECNKYCKCGEDCPNRVVQLGRKYPMSIFRTANNRGWGVKTLVDIRRSTFVMEYVGEVITNEEAERRGKEYDANGRTYLFDLDYNDDDCPFTVDAGKSGNISHFVNHSCDPNLVVYGVWVNCVDPRLPRIALFANRDIKAGEELTFDYQMTGEVGDLSPDVKVQHVACRCGAENCRGYLV